MGQLFEYAIDGSGAYHVYLEVDEASNQIDVYINEDFIFYNHVVNLIRAVESSNDISELFKFKVLTKIRGQYNLTNNDEMFEVSICNGHILIAVVTANGVDVDHPIYIEYVWDILSRFDFETFSTTPGVRKVIERLQNGKFDMI